MTDNTKDGAEINMNGERGIRHKAFGTSSISAVLRGPAAVCARAPDAFSVLGAVAAVHRQPHEAARLSAQKSFCTPMQSMKALHSVQPCPRILV